MTVDAEGFEAEMAEQKLRSKQAQEARRYTSMSVCGAGPPPPLDAVSL